MFSSIAKVITRTGSILPLLSTPALEIGFLRDDCQMLPQVLPRSRACANPHEGGSWGFHSVDLVFCECGYTGNAL